MSNWTTYPMSLRSKLPQSPGVYCIYYKNKLVYLSSTVSLRARLKNHVADGYVIPARYSLSFDRAEVEHCLVKISPCSTSTAETRATKLLSHLQPKWNYKPVKPAPVKRVKFVSANALSLEQFAEVKAELRELKEAGCTNTEAARHLRFRGRRTLRGKQWNGSAAALASKKVA